MRKKWAPIVLAVILLGTSLPPSNLAQKRTSSIVASSKTRTPELGSVEQFKAAFENDVGKVRLVALISPT